MHTFKKLFALGGGHLFIFVVVVVFPHKEVYLAVLWAAGNEGSQTHPDKSGGAK